VLDSTLNSPQLLLDYYSTLISCYDLLLMIKHIITLLVSVTYIKTILDRKELISKPYIILYNTLLLQIVMIL
jgi:hypothetical protein